MHGKIEKKKNNKNIEIHFLEDLIGSIVFIPNKYLLVSWKEIKIFNEKDSLADGDDHPCIVLYIDEDNNKAKMLPGSTPRRIYFENTFSSKNIFPDKINGLKTATRFHIPLVEIKLNTLSLLAKNRTCGRIQQDVLEDLVCRFINNKG